MHAEPHTRWHTNTPAPAAAWDGRMARGREWRRAAPALRPIQVRPPARAPALGRSRPEPACTAKLNTQHRGATCGDASQLIAMARIISPCTAGRLCMRRYHNTTRRLLVLARVLRRAHSDCGACPAAGPWRWRPGIAGSTSHAAGCRNGRGHDAYAPHTLCVDNLQKLEEALC